jgi:hypothetical protein
MLLLSLIQADSGGKEADIQLLSIELITATVKGGTEAISRPLKEGRRYNPQPSLVDRLD